MLALFPQVEQVANKFNLPDLSGAFTGFISFGSTTGDSANGQQVANQGSPQLDIVKALEIWTKVQIQNYVYHALHKVLPAQTVNASPPSREWPAGCSNAVIINSNSVKVWPHSGLEGRHSNLTIIIILVIFSMIGHCVAQIQLISCIVSTKTMEIFPGANGFLTYMQQFDIIPQIN